MTRPAVLFDFDGTLMDSGNAVVASFLHAFEVFGDPEDFTEERKVEVMGPPLEVSLGKFFPDHNVREVMDEYRSFQVKHLKELMKPMDHMHELLAWLKEEGYPLGIVTSRIRPSLEHILELFDMRQYFDVLVCPDDGIRPKPSPEGILLACRELGTEESIYVGDSISDLQAGRNAGSTVIAFLSHPGKNEALKVFGPDYAVYDLLEIRKILQENR